MKNPKPNLIQTLLIALLLAAGAGVHAQANSPSDFRVYALRKKLDAFKGTYGTHSSSGQTYFLSALVDKNPNMNYGNGEERFHIYLHQEGKDADTFGSLVSIPLHLISKERVTKIKYPFWTQIKTETLKITDQKIVYTVTDEDAAVADQKTVATTTVSRGPGRLEVIFKRDKVKLDINTGKWSAFEDQFEQTWELATISPVPIPFDEMYSFAKANPDTAGQRICRQKLTPILDQPD